MSNIERGEDRCTCKPSRENPSVIGACACPEHGMKALIRERDEAREQLQGAVSSLRELRDAAANYTPLTPTTPRAERLRAAIRDADRILGGQSTAAAASRETNVQEED